MSTRLVNPPRRKPRRCSVCGQTVRPPCRTCWLQRYAARGYRYDPLDPDPLGQDVPGEAAKCMSAKQFAAACRLFDDGHSAEEICRLADMPLWHVRLAVKSRAMEDHHGRVRN